MGQNVVIIAVDLSFIEKLPEHYHILVLGKIKLKFDWGSTAQWDKSELRGYFSSGKGKKAQES